MLCGTFHQGLMVTAVICALSCGVGVRTAPTTARWRAVTWPLSTRAAVKAGTLTRTWRAPSVRGIQRQRSMLTRMRSRRAVSLSGVLASARFSPAYWGWVGSSEFERRADAAAARDLGEQPLLPGRIERRIGHVPVDPARGRAPRRRSDPGPAG